MRLADVPRARRGGCRRGHPRSSGHDRFLFCWPDGRHLNPDWLSHEFTRMCRDAEVPILGLHDVRHTHASLMLAGGEGIKVVQERGGWASAAFVLHTSLGARTDYPVTRVARGPGCLRWDVDTSLQQHIEEITGYGWRREQ